MPSTNKTDNLNLSQFIGSDHPTWLNDYNNDMLKIDNGFLENKDSYLNLNNSFSEIQTEVNKNTANIQYTTTLTNNNTQNIQSLNTKVNSIQTWIHSDLTSQDTNVRIYNTTYHGIGYNSFLKLVTFRLQFSFQKSYVTEDLFTFLFNLNTPIPLNKGWFTLGGWSGGSSNYQNNGIIPLTVNVINNIFSVKGQTSFYDNATASINIFCEGNIHIYDTSTTKLELMKII